MRPRTRLRGQPVVVLAMLLGGWIGLRMAFWETPFPPGVADLPEALLASTVPLEGPVPVEPADSRTAGTTQASAPYAGQPVEQGPFAPLPGPVLADPIPAAPRLDLPNPLRPALVPFVPPSSAPPAPPVTQRLAAAHNMVMMAGLSGVSLPPELAGLLDKKDRPTSVAYQPFMTTVASPTGGRWSADGWVLIRDGNTTALTSGNGSYGRSQAGAVVRYALAPSSPYRPMAYARLSQAIGTRESELALGLSARPLPKVPLRAAAEVRVTRLAGQTLVRPAGYVVTELPPFQLPLGVTAEAYGQAGYVGGKYASAFVDGQVRAERQVFDLGDTKLSAGGGAWGGAQKGAARLDIGPSASVQLKLGQTNARAAVDWRFRVAGDAEPASGPALTISAGF